MINNSGDNKVRGCGQGRRDSDRPRERERQRKIYTQIETDVVPALVHRKPESEQKNQISSISVCHIDPY